ncbi:hypothetical protein [Pantanalinema sp. GBBB05]|uniref:hypothetical protein n=1 Tax=Pantanalinema sp. GBBB05 TaxID=2604139 RepID=UPI001E07B520|nr:hypothetical protein [Pantanalinema sp. GBBB05]
MLGLFTNDSVIPASSPTQTALYDIRPVGATLTKEVETRDVRGVVDGTPQSQILDTVTTQVTYGFSVEIESIDSGTLALMFGETWGASASYTGKKLKRVTVPSASPYEITDTELADLTAADIQVMLAANSSTGGLIRPLQVVTGGAPANTNEVQLDEANTKLVFHSTHAGASIKYGHKEAYTVESLGVVASPIALDDLKFFGVIATTRDEEIIVEVDLSPSGGWELPVGDESSITLEYKAIAKGSNRSAVRLYRQAA